MIVKAMLLVIVLSHGGVWFGGVDNSIMVSWSAPEANMPQATLTWQLMYQTVVVASGQADVAAGDKATTMHLKLPEARVLTGYTWKYQLKNRDTGKELESGERLISLSPVKLLAEQAKRTKGKHIVVIDGQDEGLGGALKDGGVEATRLATIGELQLRQADIILVAEHQLPENESVQESLRARAVAGAQVMIFAQQKTAKSLGVAMVARPIKSDLAWKTDHELFAGFSAAQLDGWARESAGDVKALALPADAAILELGHWRRETPGVGPVPIDALVATQTAGTGRIVWCQLPTGGFAADDPRPRMLLANALDYLLTRPEPTMPQSERTPCGVARISGTTPGEKP